LGTDRRIEDANGTKWVADYKLSEREGAGIGAFLDEQREGLAELVALAEKQAASAPGMKAERVDSVHSN